MIQHVVLDLDLTLVHSIEHNELSSARVRQLKAQFTHHVTPDFIIFERPYLRQFLRALAKRYTVSVWTAGGRSYGQYIVDNIIEPYMDKPVYLYLYDENCNVSMALTGVLKHLDLLYKMNQRGFHGFTRASTVLVDDNEEVLAQNSNVLRVAPFKFDPADNELVKILEKIVSIQ